MKAVFIEEEPERSKVGGSAPLQSGLGGSGPGSRPLRAPPFIYIYIYIFCLLFWLWQVLLMTCGIFNLSVGVCDL